MMERARYDVHKKKAAESRSVVARTDTVKI